MLNKLTRWAAMLTLTGTIVTGCATAPKTHVKTAPITYKMDKGDAQLASLDYSDHGHRAIPQDRYEPLGGQGHDFDPQKIDRNLYKHQKVGQTYTIMGQTFTPRHDPDYDRTGVASWYGPKFHGKPTANGEVFDKRAMTAAHTTLPLNSMVRVTNLENGRSVVVRLNDRGPFVGGRIIDMSEAGAEALGFKPQGTVNVRVRYLGPADPMAGERWLPQTAPRMVELPKENLSPAPAPYIPPVVPSRPLNVQRAQPQAQAPAPSMPQRTPQADLPSGGDITLTIKGPIHIAKSDESDSEPRFIAERAETGR
ncbi:MAG: septal ring lytic transglycosylase RlpA family protein [Pseudomonadota bacterium]